MLGPASASQATVDLPVADRLASRMRAEVSWRVVVVAVLLSLLVILVLVPGLASAEPLCTDTWTGAAEGEWATAANWSEGKVPGSSSVACIGAGKTAKVTEGANQTGVVQGEGTLVVSGGTFEVANALETGAIHSLTVQNAALTGAGTVTASSSFTWANSTMSGSGSTVIASGATGTINQSGNALKGRPFVNEGTTTLAKETAATIIMSEGAQIKNSGTFKANAESGPPEIKKGAGASSIVNTGTFEKAEGAGATEVAVSFENLGTAKSQTGTLVFSGGGSGNGTWSAAEGATLALEEKTFTLSGGTLSGAIRFGFATVTESGVKAENASLTEQLGSLILEAGTLTAKNVTLNTPDMKGAGNLDVSGSLAWVQGTMSGSGSTVILPGATASIKEEVTLAGRSFVNEGTTTLESATAGNITMNEGAQIANNATFKANGDSGLEQIKSLKGTAKIVNNGLFEKTEGVNTTEVDVPFESSGTVKRESGKLTFSDPIVIEASTQYGCYYENLSTPDREVLTDGEVVCTATGDFSQSQTDFSVGGRGVGLNLTRVYNSQAAAVGTHGTFGYGWSSSFSDHLVAEAESKKATLVQANGSTVPFAEGSGGTFTAPAWTQDTLSGTSSTGYTLTLPNQTVYKFAGATGHLESVTDRNANATTLSYNEAGQLTTITDPASRTIKLTYNGEGLVESAEDPMKHVVKYTYEGKNLATVTQPGEAALRWQFPKYDESHQLTEMVDGRSGKMTMAYNVFHQVVTKTDLMSRETTYEYKPFETKTTNHATGSVTVELTTSAGLAAAVIRGYGTAGATTETLAHDVGGNLLGVTDGNLHTTKYGYDTHGNRTSAVDPTEDETKWTYNSTHDIETETKPNGETTTYKRDVHGNPEVIERPAPESKTQTTKYKYTAHGQVESMEDPLKRVSKYEYDTAGDRTTEIDPETDRRTWGYNEDSQETSMVSPRGHVKAGEEAKYTTKTERDAQGRAIKVADSLLHETKYKYDGDGNLEVKTDPELHETIYTYDADNEQTKVKEANGTVTEAGYDGAGKITSQVDGNKHETKYVRNILEQVTEIVDPLAHKAIKEYDAAGNVKTLEDPAKRTKTYKYDGANRLTEVSYSSGKPATVKYEYNSDGKRTNMTDGTGTNKYTYDQLDRLTETENGHKEIAKYEYDLANEKTKITYPNTKAVTRAYDKAGRLEKVTDWSSNVTKFAYDADSNLKTTTYPTGTSNVDTYTYDETDAMKEVKMTKGAETLASLLYTRNKDAQVKGATSKGLPGEEKPAYEYDKNNRLTKGAAVAYKYDAANNPTTIGTGTYKYNAASQLETGPSLTYTYDELGERTKTKPIAGPATTYGYDQAGNLTSAERPKEGETSEIKDTYGYNGDALRASQTLFGTTTYMAWEEGIPLPLLLTDGTNSYIYGPKDLPIEQISGGGSVNYLHHDQQGSTRLLTSSTGAKEATFTYDAYGNLTGHTGTATTPLGYDAQYTSPDTGLIYLRARVYDPATAQFLTVDPAVESTRELYAYASDDPVNRADPTGKEWTASQFSHEFTKRLAAINKRLGRLTGKGVELFEEVAMYKFYKTKSELEDPTLAGADERLAYKYEALFTKIAYSIGAGLEKLEYANSPAAVFKDLISAAKGLY